MAGILTYNLSHVSAPALVLSVVFLANQCGTRGASKPQVRADNEQPPELRELLHQGNAFYRTGEYLRAIQIYDSGYQEAKRRGSMQSAVRFLNNSGGAHYEMFHYRDAVQAYLEARDLAAVQGNQETLVALCSNLSSLYFQMGDVEAARESVEQGLKLLGNRSTRVKAKFLIQYAKIRRQQKEPASAVALLKDAIEAAKAEHDAAGQAQAWDVLGNTLLDQHQLSPAENALMEALRLRESTHDDHVYYSYGALGYLRQAQGDLTAAAALFDKAVKSVGVASPSALWHAYYDRGQAYLAQSRLYEAYADFGAALKSATQWRAEVVPADAFRIGTEVTLDQVYSSFIEVGGRLYTQTGQKRFIEQTFAAAEDGRAASLRALWAGRDLTKALPGEYWEALADLNKLEAGLVSGKPAVDTVTLRRLRLKVEELEARAALDLPRDQGSPDPVDSGLLERTRKTLRPTEAYLGFHLGENESCLWVIAREGVEFRPLPPRAWFAENVALFVKALRENSPEAVTVGNRLYTQILGASKILAGKPTWILAPDGPLFELPFAALVPAVQSPGGIPLYVVERHALQIVPGVSAVFPSAGAAPDGPVIGVGDPIYNRADLRLPRRQFSPVVPVHAMELARLVGSSREIESCARIWRSQGHQPVLLQGEAANKANLMDALRRKPAVLHLAAHVLFPNQDASPGMVALSLAPAGELELIGANEIASLRLNLGLVVLNGCSSGQATILPGAGLMGMTRAWLAAGARAVIVTRWATADQNDGELFQSFYQHLSSISDSTHRKSFAQSLQEAQIAELLAGAGARILPIGLRTSVSKEIDKNPIPAHPDVDWKVVVEQIRAGDPDGEEALYRNLAAGARLFLQRKLGPQDVEDRVHNVFVIVVQAIRRGELREPERLMGFVRTVLNRQLGLAISGLIRTRERSIQLDSARHLTAVDSSPEEHALSIQKIALMKQALKQLSSREYDMLTRFYLREQPPEQIQEEMRLTPTQFNLLKSRAKAKLTDLVRRKLSRDPFNRE